MKKLKNDISEEPNLYGINEEQNMRDANKLDTLNLM